MNSDIASIVPYLAERISHMAPGPLAALRRGPLAGAGTAAFWHLAARIETGENEREWAAIMQCIAILTQKGAGADKASAHLVSLPMGEALFRSNVSELRLSRLLNAPAALRADFAVRFCRRLARGEYARFNLITLAHYVLSESGRTDQIIAQTYYRAEAKDNFESTKSDKSKS